MSVRELDRQVEKLVAPLRAASGRGDRVVIYASSAHQLLSVQLACMRTGRTPAIMPSRWDNDDLVAGIEHVCPSLIAADLGEGLSLIQVTGQGIVQRIRDFGLATFVESVTDEVLTVGGTAMRSPRSLAAAAPASAGPDAEILFFTTGTTSRPKAVRLSTDQYLRNCHVVGRRLRYRPSDRLCCPLPLDSIFGNHGVLAALSHGVPSLVSDSYDPERLLLAMKRHEVSTIYGVQTIAADLVDLVEKTGVRPRALTKGMLAPISADMMEEFSNTLSAPDIHEPYGLTETSAIVSMSDIDAPQAERWGTNGRPQPGVEVETRPVSDVQSVGGELVVKGPTLMRGYFNDSAATAAVLRDGWFYTGDVGEINDGCVRLRGRIKSLIKTRGVSVVPEHVEDCLRRHSAVVDAAVVGVPHRRQGEAVKAAVVLGPSAEPASRVEVLENLAAFARARLKRIELPTEYCVVGEVPRNQLGKVDRREVARIIGEKGTSDGGR